MKEKIFSALRIILFLGIGALLFWLVIRNQNIDMIKEKLREADWKWAALALVFGAISNIFRAARWNMLIHPLGDRPRLVNTFGAVFIGYMANLAIPRLGEVSRCAILNRYEKTPINKLFGTVVTERIIDILTIFFLLLIVVLLEFDKMSDFSMQYVFKPLGDKLNMLFSHGFMFYIIVIGAFALFLFLSWFIFLRIRKTKSFVKLRYIVQGFVTGIKTVGQLQNKGLFLFYTFMIWGLYLLMSYSCFFCFHATSSLGFIPALGVMVFGGFGWAAPVQGGFGTYHIIVTQTLVLFGIAQDDGLAFAILSHATQVFGMLSFGLLSLLFLPVINKKEKYILIKPQDMNTFPEKSKMNFDAIIREKILDVETLKRMMAVWRMKSKTIVFTNGCFDLLHPGHLHVLHAARSSGDVLIVGLNTDSSVNKLKPGRPLQDELSRATLLASLEVVDAVILFDEETPEKLIGNILPDVIVKGGDYTPDQVAGKKIVEDHGGTVEIVPLLKNFSTTRLVQKIRSQQ